MSQHCPACFGTTPGDDPKPCPGCGHEAQLDALAIREGHQDIGPCDGCSCPFCLLRAEIATLRGLIMARDSNLKLLEKAELELAALRAALVVAEEMAKLLITKCQYTLHSDEASRLAARFHAAREKAEK